MSDDRSIRGFLVARGLLERAESFVDGSAAGAVTAVIVSDLAVETAAKATVVENPSGTHPGTGYLLRPNQRRGPARDPSLPEVLDNVLAAWRERTKDANASLIELQKAARLREFRNSVQHAGVVPSADVVERSRLRAIDAVRVLARSFFDTELEQISRAQLIASSLVRGRVLLAEQHADKEEYSADIPVTGPRLASTLWEGAYAATRSSRSSLAISWHKERRRSHRPSFLLSRPTGRLVLGVGRP